ncbi:hypothetical protein M5X11_18785 [Paenibacillus alginolyticus]|uniref:hypothetical protein n=1 Tax=Paenibacillus alginolyticus TaxID=59839 RepID=UPI0004026788|nr:hypothetical protein [Paenibacillus alginolyticus]MCY9666954.1 hypothetical protein [Paenibacillus alginolyticus]
MKFKKIIIITSVALALTIAGYMYEDSKVTFADLDAMPVSHKSLSELEGRSKLIISGRPTASENHIIRDEEGFTKEAYTITNFEIEHVYDSKLGSQLKDGDVIRVAEPVYLLDNGIKPGKTQFAIEGYEPMEKKKRYLLVLKTDQNYSDLYDIVGVNDGKYSLDSTDQKINLGEKAGKFKDELINKYMIK